MYGIEIYNRFGENVVEMDKEHFYAYSTGDTKLLLDLHNEGITAMSNDGYSTSNFGDTTNISNAGLYTTEAYSQRTHAASPSGTYTLVVTSPSKGLIHPTLNLVDGDMVFYDVSTYGLLMSYAMMSYGFTDTTPLGGVAVCETEGANSIPYTLVSTRKPVASPTENYGLQIFDSAGGVVFDSRQTLFSIFDHFYISQSVFKRIIEDDTVLDLHLCESHADYRVCLPNHTSFQSYDYNSSAWRAQVMVKKLDNQTIRLSRVDNGGAKSGTWRTLYQDTILIVGR